jgi:hypothetical protein
MQLEETASAKDVPPLSTRGDFELPAFIAQNNMRPQGLARINARGNGISVSPFSERKVSRSLV